MRAKSSFHEGRSRNYRKLSQIYPPISCALSFLSLGKSSCVRLPKEEISEWDTRSFVWFNAYVLLLLLQGDGTRFNRHYLREAVAERRMEAIGRNHLRVYTKIKLIVTILWISTLSERLRRRQYIRRDMHRERIDRALTERRFQRAPIRHYAKPYA